MSDETAEKAESTAGSGSVSDSRPALNHRARAIMEHA